MDKELERIRDNQKETWNRFAGGWRKWDHKTMATLERSGASIIAMLHPEPDFDILDVAGGTGRPGLTIAEMVPQGTVTITDLSNEMLHVAREKLSETLLTNVRICVADACALPFADNSFHAVSCRMGFMFFPDMQLAANEMVRVLRPGGRLATAVWNAAEHNYWITAIMDVIEQVLPVEPTPPGSPSMFRCAPEGLMDKMFSDAGLRNVHHELVEGTVNFEGIDEYWNMFTEVAAPVVRWMANATESEREKIQSQVYANIKQRMPTNPLVFKTSAWVIGGEK